MCKIASTSTRKHCFTVYLGLSWINLLCHGHRLLFRADHACNRHVLSKLQLRNAFKTLFQVGLDTQGVFGL